MIAQLKKKEWTFLRTRNLRSASVLTWRDRYIAWLFDPPPPQRWNCCRHTAWKEGASTHQSSELHTHRGCLFSAPFHPPLSKTSPDFWLKRFGWEVFLYPMILITRSVAFIFGFVGVWGYSIKLHVTLIYLYALSDNCRSMTIFDAVWSLTRCLSIMSCLWMT